MLICQKLKERNGEICELCNNETATHEYTVSPKIDESTENQVAICNTCLDTIDSKDVGFHWRCLEGSIWSPKPSVQVLSYRILQSYKEENWTNNLISSVDLDENIIQWITSVFEVADVQKDALGNILENGDTVVLPKALNVKGTCFTASKGTVVKNKISA